MKHLMVLACVAGCLVFGHAVGQSHRDRDGHWWRNQSPIEKAVYVVGFFDGMHLGHRFSVWAFEAKEPLNKGANEAMVSFEKYSSRFFGKATNTQVSDGLDSFYSDFRNRSIAVNQAIWIVANQIAGTPSGEVEIMTENHRRNASRRAE